LPIPRPGEEGDHLLGTFMLAEAWQGWVQYLAAMRAAGKRK